jgi:transposase, IS30 family
MGRHYGQFSLEERCTLSQLSQAGKTVRQIAAVMDRAPSTITRELKRNSGAQLGYQPAYAEQQAKSRRWRGSRLLRKPALQQAVLKALAQGWSPAQVAGRLRKESRRTVISYESIYRFIDSQIRRTKDYSWRHYLARGKSKRGWRGHKGGSAVDHIQDRVAIDRRPAYIHKRRQPGHWEADLMLFARYGQAVLVTHERRSRLLVLWRQTSKAAEPVAKKLGDLFTSLPIPLRRTITFDNGTEFAYHYRLHKLSMRTFFCDPHAPWQKGGIENAIGRMRRGLPRKTDLVTLSENRLLSLIRSYNQTPRKCLNYKTPAEVFCNELLHLKRESTCPHSRTRRSKRRSAKVPNRKLNFSYVRASTASRLESKIIGSCALRNTPAGSLPCFTASMASRIILRSMRIP